MFSIEGSVVENVTGLILKFADDTKIENTIASNEKIKQS